MRCLMLVAALVLFLPGAAFGLSCARPSLDETAIDAAIMIFEGTAGSKRALDLREKAAVRIYSIDSIYGSAEDLKVYGFTVTQGWKGATTGQSVDVLFNGYWGETVSPRAKPTSWSARDGLEISCWRRFAATLSI